MDEGKPLQVGLAAHSAEAFFASHPMTANTPQVEEQVLSGITSHFAAFLGRPVQVDSIKTRVEIAFGFSA